MRILIHDASVLIDLLSVERLGLALSLPYSMETTDLVKREIIRAGQETVLDRVIAARRSFPATHSCAERLRSVRFPCMDPMEEFKA